MKQTIVEKIFSEKIGKKVFAGDTVFSPVDLTMGTDGTAPIAIEVFKEFGLEQVQYPEKIVLVNDHFTPATDIKTANLALAMKEFARKHKVKNFFEVGRSGICHVILPEKGLINPYDVIVGADSHTCTYGALGVFSTGAGSTDIACVWATGKLWFKIPETTRVELNGNFQENVYAKDLVLYLIGKLGISGATYEMLEFEGELLKNLDISSRLTICNMVVETGAKAGFFNIDEATMNYYRSLNKDVAGLRIDADNDARFKHKIEIDVSKIEPLIACPYSPANIKPAKDLENLKINQVVIGSCTNGRIEDFRLAHKYLKNNSVHPEVKLIIIPGSQKVLQQLEEENLLIDFIKCGAVISSPTCGPCMGGHMGVLAKNEVGLYTTNRNFYGRNGDPTSQVFLCNPVIAAYSAIKGRIQIPV